MQPKSRVRELEWIKMKLEPTEVVFLTNCTYNKKNGMEDNCIQELFFLNTDNGENYIG